MDLHEKLIDEVDKFLNSLVDIGITTPLSFKHNPFEYYNFIEKYLGYAHRAAIILAHYNYQVENGGHIQYIDNGYGLELPEVTDIFEFGKRYIHYDFKQLFDIVESVNDLGKPEDYNEIEEYEDPCPCCDDHGEVEDEDEEIITCYECGGEGYFSGTDEFDGHYEFQKLTDPLDKKYYKIKNRLDLFNQLLSEYQKREKDKKYEECEKC